MSRQFNTPPRAPYNAGMPTFPNQFAEFTVYGLLILIGLILLWIGYKIGRGLAGSGYERQLREKQADLFTTQQGFKKLYEAEITAIKAENTALSTHAAALEARVEEYRRKAAGFGGLFSSGGKKSDAMYALLLENEALEEALHKQNQKLATERTDGLKESMRNIGYRRVLMSQLLNDNRIKDYVREILEDDRRLPKFESGGSQAKALPEHVE
ncbi:MAG TPA: hypothetical protein VGB55_11555 [Tepidisphaeraceae bacterium]|jgi:cell division protein FtsB